MSSFEIEKNLEISSAEIERLRALVGWPNQAGYDKILAGSYSHFSVKKDGLLIGFLNVISDGVLDALLVDLMVHPAHQKQGIGQKMLSAAISSLTSDGIRYIQLIFIAELQDFYKKCGFKDFQMAVLIDNSSL